jgi:hypothetical protein
MNNPAPTAMEITTSSVNIAFPTTMTGWRARRDGRVGSGTLSGSSAARGLRGNGALPVDGPLLSPSAGRFEFT